MDELKKDKRFAHIAKDPRFHHIPRRERKVKIDQRFKGMFEDKKFKIKYTVDKRGRPVNTTTNENLRRFYELSDSDDSESESEAKKEVKKKDKKVKNSDKIKDKDISSAKKEKDIGKSEEIDFIRGKVIKTDIDQPGPSIEEGGSSEEESDKEKDEIASGSESGSEELGSDSETDGSEGSNEDSGVDGGIDLARGEGNIASSDESDDEFGFKEEQYDHKWGELDHDAPPAKEITCRLAICNMDWDRMKAQDIMVLMNSFKPSGGVIKAVTIYPSEYGLQRLKEEEVKGPRELTETKLDSDESDAEADGDEIGSHYHREKLRLYQLNRMKYFYAVVECDSPETANKIYDECDGMEYESSSTKLDLRFIPEDMTFDREHTSKETSLPDASIYKPSLFSSSALNQSKVNLTWDETNPDRLKVTTKKFENEDLEELDMNAYLASSSDEDDTVEKIKNKYAENSDSEHDGGDDNDDDDDDDDDDEGINKYRNLLKSINDEKKVQEEKDMQMEITWEPGLKETTEELVKKKNKANEKLTPWEEYLDKRKEKKKKRREENKKDKEEEEEEEISDDDLPSDVDLNDPFFQQDLDSDNDTNSKKKAKKKGNKSEKPDNDGGDNQKNAELELLMMDSDDDKEHFNLKDIMENEKQDKKKKKKKKLKHKKPAESEKVQDSFQMKVDDPRFAAMYQSHLYNIDPSAPEFKKTKGIEAIINEKVRRRQREASSKIEPPTKIQKLETNEPSEDKGLSALVKSIKMKTQKKFQKKKS